MVDQSTASGVPQSGSSDPNGYNVSFFKPQTAHGRANIRLIIAIVVVWLVAVFGFQGLLMITSKPTPEPTKAVFDEVWPAMIDGSATSEAKQAFAKATLSVLGKNIVLKPDHKETLSQALTVTVADLLGDEAGRAFLAGVATADDTTRPALVAQAKTAIGLTDDGLDRVRADLLPFALVAVQGTQLSDTTKASLPGIMELYLVHNRGPLTDLGFLGFPFHYWYTAQFLLIMFVLMCLIYALKIEKIHKQHGFVED